MFMPFARREAQNAEAEKTTPTSGGEIDDLKRQLDEMQKRIEKLSDTKTS
jgi:polyhydroxyalkanoate synthesis regulator protein